MLVFKKETTLPILVTVISVLAAALTILYGYRTGKFPWLENRNKEQMTGQNEEVKINRTEYTDVSRKTLDWIDKQRNDEGWYILGKVCGQEDCEIVWDDKEVGNKDGLIATWARLNFYEQHRDEKDLNIVKKDIDLFYNKYKDKDLSDSLWLCKVTYEMAQSKYVDKEQKDKLKELCLKKKILEFNNNDRKIKQNDLLKKGGMPKVMNYPYYVLLFRKIYFEYGNVSDLIFQYKFGGDKLILRQSENYFLKIQDDDGDGVSSNNCLLGLGAIDLYKLSMSKVYLKFAINVFDKTNKEGSLDSGPFCWELSKNLYEITRDVRYHNVLEKHINELVESYKVQNMDGFFMSPESYPYRDVSMNGLFVQLLK